MTRPQKSPAMPLYGKDAWSDERFLLLDWDAQGLFWRLSFWQWMEGSIPSAIDAVIDVVGKASRTRKLWPKMLQFFVPHPSIDGRLYNTRLDDHRERMLEERRRKIEGADKTNAQRTAKRTGQRPEEGDATRAATANTDSLPGSELKPEEKKLTPQQTAVKRVVDALEEHTHDFLVPDGGRISKWLSSYGIDAIVGAIKAEGARGNLDGKNASYLQQCIESYARRPRERTAKRNSSSGKTDTSRTEQPTARDLGMRTADEVLAAVAAKR